VPKLAAVAACHDAAEDLVLWPAVRRFCTAGDELASLAQEQEQKIRLVLSELERVPPGGQEFLSCARTAFDLVTTHFRHEENIVWPRLAARLGPADMAHLVAQWRTAQWLTARRRRQTRPHRHSGEPVPIAQHPRIGKSIVTRDKFSPVSFIDRSAR
jgi:hypothetical protein